MTSSDLDYEQRAYHIRQGASVLLGLVLAAALLGLLGRSGPLSDKTARAGGDLVVGYERFLRLKTPTEVAVQMGTGSGETDVAISRTLLDDF